MIVINKFGICSETKTYANPKTTAKAIAEIERCVPEDVRVTFMIVKLDEHNCENAKYYGRFIPVAIGVKAAELHLYQLCHILG